MTTTKTTPGWANRLSLIRQALSRHPNMQRTLDEVVSEIQAESTQDGMGAACAALDAFVGSLRGEPDISAEDVLDGVQALSNDMKTDEVQSAAKR